MADFEKEKELIRYQHESIIKEQREEIINVRENLRVKNSIFNEEKRNDSLTKTETYIVYLEVWHLTTPIQQREL